MGSDLEVLILTSDIWVKNAPARAEDSDFMMPTAPHHLQKVEICEVTKPDPSALDCTEKF